MDDERAARDCEDRRFAAMLAGDWDALEALCDARLIYIHSSGVGDSRDSYLGKTRSGHYVYHELDHPISGLVLLGDTALVAGEMNGEITANGEPRTLRSITLAVWQRNEAGAWLLIGFQATPRPRE